MGCKPCESESGRGKECQDIRAWACVSLADFLSKSAAFAQSECYLYTVRTTRRLKDNSICHWGSGPNLEGGLATLCTCKHDMRSGRRHREWPNTWIVGLTSRDKRKGFDGRHYLFYMTRVQRVFSTHKELFEFLTEEYPDALAVKLADQNRLGDVFRPRADLTVGDWLSPSMYHPPIINHSHCKTANSDEWHNDVSLARPDGTRMSIPLLVADPEMTFVWNRPTIKYRGLRGIGYEKFESLGELISRLECS